MAQRSEATRTIQFFRIDAGQNEAGRPNPFEHGRFMDAINQLTWVRGQASRYLTDDLETDLCAHVDSQTEMRLSRVRRGSLPMVERAGQVSPLLIDPDQGLLETIHIVWFDNSIVGADYNHYGPRLSRLSDYFEDKCGLRSGAVRFNPLLKQDSLAELEHLENISLLTLKIRTPYAAVVAQADQSLGAAFSAAREAVGGDGAEVEVVLRPAVEDRRSFFERHFSGLRRLAERTDLRSGARRFKVTGRHDETHRLDTVDLLSDRLISRKSVVRSDARSRAIDPNSAFAAIREAYDELREELVAAAEVVNNESNQN